MAAAAMPGDDIVSGRARRYMMLAYFEEIIELPGFYAMVNIFDDADEFRARATFLARLATFIYI